jgi:hypothetical protein
MLWAREEADSRLLVWLRGSMKDIGMGLWSGVFCAGWDIGKTREGKGLRRCLEIFSWRGEMGSKEFFDVWYGEVLVVLILARLSLEVRCFEDSRKSTRNRGINAHDIQRRYQE